MPEGIDDDVEEYLRGAALPATLATCANDRPHAASLWYRYADGVIEVVTTGRKLDNLRTNPRAALSVVSHDRGRPAWEVIVRGTATIVDDAAATKAANRRINEKYGVAPHAWEGENTLVRVSVGSAQLKSW